MRAPAECGLLRMMSRQVQLQSGTVARFQALEPSPEPCRQVGRNRRIRCEERRCERRSRLLRLGRQPDESLLIMDEALERLARTDPLKTQLIEMRYFGGMTAEESATVLSMSVHVVRRELRLAQAWLHREMVR